MPPAPRPANNGLLIALLAGGGCLAILIVIAVLVATGVLTHDERGAAADRLAAAAQRLTTARVVGLRGTVTSGTNKLNGDMAVTRGGRVTGTVTWSGQSVQLIAVNSVMYVKGSADFWRDQGDGDDRWIGSGRWGLLGPTPVDLTIRQHLTPGAIARELRGVSRYTVKDTKRTSVRGTPALKVSTTTGSFYVSAGDSPRLLRIETTYPQVALDVTEYDGDGGGPVAELRERIKQLKGSFDPAQRTRVDKVGWGSCAVAGCTVHSDVRSTRGEASTIRVTVFVRLTANDKNGRKLGECSASGTVTSAASVRVSCRVTSAAWSRFRGGSGFRRWWAHAEAMPGGAADRDIQTMLNGLDSE